MKKGKIQSSDLFEGYKKSNEKHKLNSSFSVPDKIKDEIKNRLMKRIERSNHKISDKRKFPKFVFSFVVPIILLFFYFYKTPEVVPRDMFSYINIDKGECMVKNPWDDQYHPIRDISELVIGSNIKTGDKSSATIYFFDDSILRLDPNTELVIVKLAKHPYIPKTGIIDLKLITGQIWNRVFQVKDQFSRYIVKTDNAIITTNDAAFSVSINNKTSIRSHENNIDIIVLNNEKKKIIANTSINNSDEINIYKDNYFVSKTKTQDTNYIKSNIKKDNIYISKLLNKSITKLFDNNHLSDKEETIASMNYKYKQALSYIKTGDKERAKTKIEEYKKDVITALDKSNDKYLKVKIYNDLVSKEKDLLPISSDSDVFLLKKEIKDIKNQFTNTNDNIILGSTNIKKERNINKVENLDIKHNTRSLVSDITSSLTTEILNKKKTDLENKKRIEEEKRKKELMILAIKQKEEEDERRLAYEKQITELRTKKNNEKAKEKADLILNSIDIYISYEGKYNKLLGELKDLGGKSEYKKNVLNNLLNNVPIQLRHKVKEELTQYK